MKLGVRAMDAQQTEAASRLAERLGVRESEAGPDAMPDAELVLDQHGLALHGRAPELAALGAPLRVDFVSGSFGHRLRHGGGRGQPIARAAGLSKGTPPPTVLDATAGLGRDAFLLAWLGCTVTALERDAVVHALLEDGMRRALDDPALAAGLGGRLRFLRAEAAEHLAACGRGEHAAPDVVLLDPMHPERGKSALVKREMRWFRALVGDDADAVSLLAPAIAVARKRVVVKRPIHVAPLGPGVSFAARGRSTRFDVHLRPPGAGGPPASA